MFCPSHIPACSCWFSQASKTVSLFHLPFSGFTFGFDKINFLNSNFFAVQSVYFEALNCCLQFIYERPVKVPQFSFFSCCVKCFLQPCCTFTSTSVWYYHCIVSNVCHDTTVLKWWAVASRQFLPFLTNYDNLVISSVSNTGNAVNYPEFIIHFILVKSVMVSLAVHVLQLLILCMFSVYSLSFGEFNFSQDWSIPVSAWQEAQIKFISIYNMSSFNIIP